MHAPSRGAAQHARAGAEAPCPTKTCLSPKALGESKTCAYQFQYVDTSTKKRVCGAPTCRTSSGAVPSPWTYPLSFSCPGAASAFFCSWDHRLTTWRAMNSGAGALMSLLYVYVLRSCQRCVGCAVAGIGLMCFGHALFSFACMVQDSDAVRRASALCAEKTIKCPVTGGEEEEGPDCLMSEFVVVCVLDALVGVVWCVAGYTLCRRRRGPKGLA